MKPINIKVYTNEQATAISNQLKAIGYRKVNDCYWYEDWENITTGAKVTVERMN